MRSALQQNECYDIFTDDFASLADDDLGASASAETAMVEVHSFTSLRYNKGKTVACVDWVPGAFGVVAASCVATASFEAAVKDGGAETPGAVLIWDFEDPIHPRYVLEAPADVRCFQFNRSNPRLVAGGLANGRACLWDTSEMMTKNTHERDGKNVLSCVPKFVSEAPDSHVCAVTDVRWLGADVAVTKPRGELVRPNPPTGACGFFATTAADGKVLFWDVDVKKDAKKRDFFLTPSYKIKLGRGEQSGTLQAVKFDFSPALRPPARDGARKTRVCGAFLKFWATSLSTPSVIARSAGVSWKNDVNAGPTSLTGVEASRKAVSAASGAVLEAVLPAASGTAALVRVWRTFAEATSLRSAATLPARSSASSACDQSSV